MKWLLVLSLALVSYHGKSEIFTLHKGLTSSKAEMTQVAKVAECILKKEEFLKEVGRYSKYTHTNLVPKQVETKIRSGNASAVISTYYKKYSVFPKRSSVVAYRNVGSNIIYYNAAKFPRELKEMVNTLFHEWLHIEGFDHGNNSPSGKGATVNYAVGLMSEKYVEGCK